MKRIHYGLLILLTALITPAAAQDFSDDFESYSTGDLCSQSTWEEWCGSIDVCGVVSTEQAHSGSNSLKLEGAVGGSNGQGDDTVHTFSVEGGVWTFVCWTFIPDNMAGACFIILLNTYPGFGCPQNANWSLQVWLDGDLDTVHADFDDESLPLIRGRWVEFRAEIDLDNDQVDYFYDGVQFVFDKSWKEGVSGGGQAAIQALDLYAGEPTFSGSTGHYIDDVSLTSAAADPCADNGCVGGACNFKKLVCKTGAKLISKGSGTPGDKVCVTDANGNFVGCATVNDRGKWKNVERGDFQGSHTRQACGGEKSTDCL